MPSQSSLVIAKLLQSLLPSCELAYAEIAIHDPFSTHMSETGRPVGALDVVQQSVRHCAKQRCSGYGALRFYSIKYDSIYQYFAEVQYKKSLYIGYCTVLDTVYMISYGGVPGRPCHRVLVMSRQ